MTNWTPEQDALLLQHAAVQPDARAIARQLPWVRHLKDGGRLAVIGRLWRLRNPQPKKPRPKGTGPKINPTEVLAAAIVLEGGSFDEAMEETGLDWERVRRAVINAKAREAAELRQQRDENTHVR